jgi:hypothetical protein
VHIQWAYYFEAASTLLNTTSSYDQHYAVPEFGFIKCASQKNMFHRRFLSWCHYFTALFFIKTPREEKREKECEERAEHKREQTPTSQKSPKKKPKVSYFFFFISFPT